jgi:predicted ATP-dependent Lon-type protease
LNRQDAAFAVAAVEAQKAAAGAQKVQENVAVENSMAVGVAVGEAAEFDVLLEMEVDRRKKEHAGHERW